MPVHEKFLAKLNVQLLYFLYFNILSSHYSRWFGWSFRSCLAAKYSLKRLFAQILTFLLCWKPSCQASYVKMKEQFQCKMKWYFIMRNYLDKDVFICKFIDMCHTQVSLVFFWRWAINQWGQKSHRRLISQIKPDFIKAFGFFLQNNYIFTLDLSTRIPETSIWGISNSSLKLLSMQRSLEVLCWRDGEFI